MSARVRVTMWGQSIDNSLEGGRQALATLKAAVDLAEIHQAGRNELLGEIVCAVIASASDGEPGIGTLTSGQRKELAEWLAGNFREVTS